MGINFNGFRAGNTQSNLNIDDDFLNSAIQFITEKAQEMWKSASSFVGSIFGGGSASADSEIGSGNISPQGKSAPNVKSIDPEQIFDQYDKGGLFATKGDGVLEATELMGMKNGLKNDSRFANIDLKTQAEFESELRSKMGGGVTKSEFMDVVRQFQGSLGSQNVASSTAEQIPRALPVTEADLGRV